MIDANEPAGVSDPYNLSRFVQAQEDDYEQALSEIRRGRKQSHWMWYIFPQIAGLGSSSTSKRYAIRSAAEAEAYLAGKRAANVNRAGVQPAWSQVTVEHTADRFSLILPAVTAVGTNPKSAAPHYSWGLDCVVLHLAM
jgi:hypothetical protein